MINAEKFKEKLGEIGKTLSEEKIKELMQTQYQLANTLFDVWAVKGNKITETFEIKSTHTIIEHKNNGNACTIEVEEFNFRYSKTYVR